MQRTKLTIVMLAAVLLGGCGLVRVCTPDGKCY